MVGALSVDLLVLSAPSGYGKSVLAAQIASELFDEAIWICASELAPSMRATYEVVARRLGARIPDVASGGVAASAFDEAELLALAGDATRQRPPGSICIVLDDLSPVDGQAAIARLARAIQRPAPDRVLLVLTTRLGEAATAANDACVLGLSDLRLSADEAESMLCQFGGSPPNRADTAALLELAQGQAALVAVLARHACLEASTDCSIPLCGEDLRGLLRRLAREQLDPRSRLTLYVAALFGTGDSADVEWVTGEDEARRLRAIGERIPLLRASSKSHVCEFVVHDLARDEFSVPDFDADEKCAKHLRARVIERLTEVGRYARALELLGEGDSESSLAGWLSEHGTVLVAEGHLALVETTLAELSPADVMHTRVMLLTARTAVEREEPEQALRRAMVAYRLAHEESDQATAAEALALIARIHLSRGHHAQASETLDALLSLDDDALSRDVQLLTRALGGVATALAGAPLAGLVRISDAQWEEQGASTTPETKARIANMRAFIEGVARGLPIEALRALRGMRRMAPVTSCSKQQLLGNSATAMLELGRVGDASAIYGELREHCRERGDVEPAPDFWMIEAACDVANGLCSGLDTLSRVLAASRLEGDTTAACDNLYFASMIQLASGNADSSLGCAEESYEMAETLGIPVFAERAAVQMRAAILAMGDVDAARHVTGSLAWATEHDAQHVALLARLVLAECARLDGDPAAAVAHVRPSADYLRSGNANWMTAMHLRAFPGLLGVVAAALGPDAVPIRLLRLLLPEHVAVAMPLAREALTTEQWSLLARRTRFPKSSLPQSRHDAGPAAVRGQLRVRFFGGLEVVAPCGPVSEKCWRKRKARLLFAMLAVRRGRDIAREVLFERLWPDLPEGRARNNFYVTWSAMKAALMPGAARGEACPWFECVGDICRSKPTAVRTDLDDFDEALSAARKAAADEVYAAAFEQYDRLAAIYRGEVLPGDLYDDWFAPVRDAYRQEFGSAMAEASSLAEDRDDPVRALRYARAGLAHDPWREDLYQLALRHQISTGQRSAAIETYFACRSKLVDDLGIDPSRETLRLYERVLAMEDEAVGSA